MKTLNTISALTLFVGFNVLAHEPVSLMCPLKGTMVGSNSFMSLTINRFTENVTISEVKVSRSEFKELDTLEWNLPTKVSAKFTSKLIWFKQMDIYYVLDRDDLTLSTLNPNNIAITGGLGSSGGGEWVSSCQIQKVEDNLI